MPMTDVACRSSKCPADKVRARFTDAGGLYIEVSPNGRRNWFWKFRFADKEKRLALGGYPEVSLADARLARDGARLQFEAGTDPPQHRRISKAARRVAVGNTFEAVARAWHENWKGAKSPRHAD